MSNIVLIFYHIAYKLHILKIPFLPTIINKFIVRIIFSCQIGLGAKIGKKVILGYGGLGIVIHHDCIIDDNVRIGTNVTIGGNFNKNGVPHIGECTIISTGAKIFGNITIGKNCVIGANCVVLSSIPDNSVVVGIPGRIIKSNIEIKDYL